MEIKLKITHCYYFQIQGYMFPVVLNRVDFVVWCKITYCGTLRLRFDERFWQKALHCIDYFYCRAFVPELFTHRVER